MEYQDIVVPGEDLASKMVTIERAYSQLKTLGYLKQVTELKEKAQQSFLQNKLSQIKTN